MNKFKPIKKPKDPWTGKGPLSNFLEKTMEDAANLGREKQGPPKTIEEYEKMHGTVSMEAKERAIEEIARMIHGLSPARLDQRIYEVLANKDATDKA